MTYQTLRLAGAAAVLASEALPVAAQERPSMALVLIGPRNDSSWAEAAIARSRPRPQGAAGRRSPDRSLMRMSRG